MSFFSAYLKLAGRLLRVRRRAGPTHRSVPVTLLCEEGDLPMRSYDLAPLYRTTVGFDRMFDLLDGLSKSEGAGYPPYNIERVDDDRYQITVA
ncbi:MAG TPA: hypothetical protein DEA40_08980, partial [Parvularcula sp.]|nr:hypothetical protein [Parvularcula sp.]